MWECGMSYSLGFGKWFMSGGIIGFTIKSIIIVALFFLLYRFFMPNNSNVSTNLDRKDSLEILKVRFAKGEISEQEYQRMKNVLS